MEQKFRYFEDYEVGMSRPGVLDSYPRRTVTVADIVNFGCLAADYNQVHMDKHRGMKTVYGERVAHGLLISSLVTGMLSLDSPHIIGRAVPGAYFYGFELDYRGGTVPDTTVNVQWRIAEKIDVTPYPGYGIVKTAVEVVTQDDVIPVKGTVSTLIKKASAKDAKLVLKPEKPWKVEEVVPDPNKEYYIEDYEIGKGAVSDGRTITEADIVNFAGLTGDYNPRHCDAEFAKKDIFGERIAHGMLVFVTAFALRSRSFRRHIQRPGVGFAGHAGDSGTFLAPVKIGDTIHCQWRIASSRISKSNPKVGLVTHEIQIINQRNEVVISGGTVMMGLSKAGAAERKGLT